MSAVTDSGSPFAPQTGTLSDDGAHSDGAANDGVYGASLAAPSQPGQYGVSVTAVANGSQRIAPASFTVNVAVPIAKGWNLVDIPMNSTYLTSASNVISDIDAQIGAGTITALATYSDGGFNLYVPGYSADQTLQPSQGVFVLSKASGTWSGTGSGFTGGQPVQLQPGWNLVAAPFPYKGLTAATIRAQVPSPCASPTGCNVQEVAVYSNGSYTTWAPGSSDMPVPANGGMWLECRFAATWTPSGG